MAKYRLRYSPLFYEDFEEIIGYLLSELHNEQAARKLVGDVEAAIQARLRDPLSTVPYQSLTSRPNQYRRILVGNYLLFYVVIGNTMVVRRMLYGRRDIDKIL